MAKVLLAADPASAHTRGPLRPCLEAAGHEVQEVTDGPAVLAAMRTTPPDVLVLDTALRALDGFQVLLRLHRERPIHRVPVVVLSGVAPAAVRQLLDEIGVAAYLQKPVSCQMLADAVDRVLGLRLAVPPPQRAPTLRTAVPSRRPATARWRTPAGRHWTVG
jgi:CheY-like chemotaxis protein